jgi:hypothetical protein
MKEFPSIINSSKAPRKSCVAFDKLDGSNIRVKYTAKKGFCLFGSRTQLIDHTHPHLGEVVPIFMRDFAGPLTEIFEKKFPNEREILVFGEFLGEQSFAGIHVPGDLKRFVMFDVMVGHKNPKFMLPREFIKTFEGKVTIPRVIYEGNLSDQLIADVRGGKYGVNEGVICKGNERSGAFAGGVWMCKIKTEAYFQRLLNRFGTVGVTQHWE